MRPFTDEQLVAYVDGELAGSAAREIREAAAVDPQLARRIDAFASSRRLLESAFQAKKNEPVPDRLLAVFDLPAAPARPAGGAGWSRRRAPRMPLAMAAVLVLAIGVGVGILSRQHAGPAVALVDSPEMLSAALESNPSGVPYISESGGVRHEVVPVSTLRLKAGGWCREFDSATVAADSVRRTRGVACRTPEGHWVARAVAAEAPTAPRPRDDSYALASGPELVPSVGPADMLPPAQEDSVIASHWASN